MIDVFKLIMSVFVVSLHTLFDGSNDGGLLIGIWRTLANMAVPFFFLCTGYFLWGKISGKGVKKVCFASFRKYVKLYFVWTVIYLPLAVIYYVRNHFSVQSAVKNYIRELFLSGQHYNSWVLWYLLSAIYAIAALCFIHMLIKDKGLFSAVLLFRFLLQCTLCFVLCGGRLPQTVLSDC